MTAASWTSHSRRDSAADHHTARTHRRGLDCEPGELALGAITNGFGMSRAHSGAWDNFNVTLDALERKAQSRHSRADSGRPSGETASFLAGGDSGTGGAKLGRRAGGNNNNTLTVEWNRSASAWPFTDVLADGVINLVWRRK